MTKKVSGPMTIQFKKDQIVCTSNENDYDLYLIHQGKLMIFADEGSRITPIAFLNSGEYFGELSFFDHLPRSANAICLEETTLIKIPVNELEAQCPSWLMTLSKAIVKKLRNATSLMAEKGIRKKNVETIQALSIEDQRHYYQILKEHQETTY